MPTRRDALPFLYRIRPRRHLGLGRISPRTLAFFAIALGVIGLAGWLYLQQASQAASYAHKIGELQRENERLHRENLVLRAEVAQFGSLERVEELADEQGFVLPDAADGERDLDVVIEPIPEPTIAPTVQAEGEVSPEGLELRTVGLLRRLMSQLREWIESPVGEDESG